MFGELLESRAQRRRNRGGTVASVIGHTALIALAVMSTRTPLGARVPVERVVPLPVLNSPAPRPGDPAPARSPAPTAPVAPAAPIVTVPDIILPGIPPVDISRSPATVIGSQFDGSSLTTGLGTNAVAGGDEGGIPFAPGVDKPAIAMPGNPTPHYPEILRRASVRGEVVIQVVIDTTGRADMGSVRVLASDHQLLTDAVLAALPRARFLPAESSGRKVRMWAVQSFVFEVR